MAAGQGTPEPVPRRLEGLAAKDLEEVEARSGSAEEGGCTAFANFGCRDNDLGLGAEAIEPAGPRGPRPRQVATNRLVRQGRLDLRLLVLARARGLVGMRRVRGVVHLFRRSFVRTARATRLGRLLRGRRLNVLGSKAKVREGTAAQTLAQQGRERKPDGEDLRPHIGTVPGPRKIVKGSQSPSFRHNPFTNKRLLARRRH